MHDKTLTLVTIYSTIRVVVAISKLVDKLINGTIQKKELDTLLLQLGLERFRGKGSHEVWGHRAHSDVHIVIATHSKEVPKYQLRQIARSLQKRGLI